MCEQGDLQLLKFLGTMFRITNAGSVGVHGVIPGIANLAPEAAARGWEAGEAGDAATVKECNAKLLVAAGISRLSKGGGPNAASLAGMKAALKIMGILDSDTVSRPLRPLTDEEKQGIPGILADLGLSNGS
jgi:4-hydroxy-tetrahydrodipicolinate synthase